MRIRLLIAFILVSTISFAQTTYLTTEQMLKGAPNKVLKPLPQFVKWMGDNSFVMKRDGKTFLVDCKTGAEKEYTEVKTLEAKVINEVNVKNNDLFHKTDAGETQLTNNKDIEKNPTLSPDGQYVAFTRNNNLFTIKVMTKPGNNIISLHNIRVYILDIKVAQHLLNQVIKVMNTLKWSIITVAFVLTVN